MILDNIQQLKRYQVPQTEAILKFIATHDCVNLPDGEMEIDGRNLFVRIMSYAPKPADQNRFETHRINADLQYVAQGIELMQIVPSDALTPATDYDAKGDYQFYTAEKNITDLVVRQGEFTVFYPGEAHRPSCLYQNNKGLVKKLVFKIKI